MPFADHLWLSGTPAVFKEYSGVSESRFNKLDKSINLADALHRIFKGREFDLTFPDPVDRFFTKPYIHLETRA